MNHLDRYIVREHIAPFFISNALILFIFTLNLALQMLGRIVGKGLDPMLIAEFFFLNLAWIITLSVPMSVLVACLMAFGRLAGDHEIVAMKAVGVGINRMIRPVLMAGLLVTAFSLYFQDQVLPDMNHRNKLLTTAIKRRQPNVVLRQGTFTREIPRQTLLVREIEEGTDTLRNVTIFDESNQNQPTTILAKTGKMTFVDTLGMFQFKLWDGEIHQTEREDPTSYQIMNYDQAMFRIESTDQVLQRKEKGYRGDRELGLAGLTERVEDLRARPDPERYTRQINRYLVEYHKKWAISFAAIVFVLVGAPLGIKLTHGGLGVSGPLSVVFFLLYWTFLIGGEDVADRGIAPPWLAMWAPNIILGLMGWGLIRLEIRQHSSFRFPWQRKRVTSAADEDTGWSDLSREQVERMAAREKAKVRGDESLPETGEGARPGPEEADAGSVGDESRQVEGEDRARPGSDRADPGTDGVEDPPEDDDEILTGGSSAQSEPGRAQDDDDESLTGGSSAQSEPGRARDDDDETLTGGSSAQSEPGRARDDDDDPRGPA